MKSSAYTVDHGGGEDLPGKDYVGPRAGEQNGHMGPRAGEQNGHMGPRAGAHEGHMGPGLLVEASIGESPAASRASAYSRTRTIAYLLTYPLTHFFACLLTDVSKYMLTD